MLDLPITPSEAVLGCALDVETLDSIVKINIMPGTESEKLICVKEKGYFDEYGNRGDLIVKTQIVVPKKISSQERDLYEKIQKITEFVPRNNWRWHKKVV